MLGTSTQRRLDLLMRGYLAAALIAALAGIGGYFHLYGGASDMFLLYGRARGATLQTYGHPLALPPTAQAFKEQMGNLEPLTAKDVAELVAEIERLLASPKYRDF